MSIHWVESTAVHCKPPPIPRGGLKVIQLLLDQGADVNTLGGRFGNALQAAAYHGKIEVIQLLLDKGADVNSQGGMFGTVLQAAAYSGKTEVIQLLLDNGANINASPGKYGSMLEKMLALEPADTGQKVPGDVPLLVELLQEHSPTFMKWLPEAKYEEYASRFVNQDRCSLDVFRGLLAEKGWKGGVHEDVMDGGVEHGDEDALLGTPVQSGLGAAMHVWKLLGFASLVFLLYMFWAARGNRPLVAGIPKILVWVCQPRQAYYLPREAQPAMAGIPTVPLMAGIPIFHGAWLHSYF